MEDFILFTKYKTPSVKEMQVTIQRSGVSITLNRAAYDAIGTPSGVQLLYAVKFHQVAIRPIDITKEPGTRINRQGTSESFYIAGKAFTNHYEIDTSIARRYKAQLVNGDLIVDLNGPSADVTGPRLSNKPTTSHLDGVDQKHSKSQIPKELPLQNNQEKSAQELVNEIKGGLAKLANQGMSLEEILLQIKK